jgi:1,2-diacylglycerol 3-alpha-glucosyltransferase
MKIAIFTDTFVPQINGVVTFVSDISKELSDRGHKVYIICSKFNNCQEFNYPNVKVIRMGSIPAYFYEDFRFTLPLSWSLYKFLKKEKIDIIHFHTPITLGLQAILISKILKVPLIGTYHTNIADPNYLKHVKLNYKPIQKVSWKYNNYYYDQCDLITCPSEVTRQELKKNNFKKPIKTISNGINM